MTQDRLDQAKATLRAYANGSSTRPVLTAAATVLEQLDAIERRMLVVDEEFQPDTDYSRGAYEAAYFIRTGLWPQEETGT